MDTSEALPHIDETPLPTTRYLPALTGLDERCVRLGQEAGQAIHGTAGDLARELVDRGASHLLTCSAVPTPGRRWQ